MTREQPINSRLTLAARSTFLLRRWAWDNSWTITETLKVREGRTSWLSTLAMRTFQRLLSDA